MSDNPFAEPEDDNRTVIRPNPGRRRSPSPEPAGKASNDAPPTQAAPGRPPAGPTEGVENIAVGSDALTAAAAPLLQLMARLRNTVNPPDSGDLYQRTVQQIRVFER